MKKLILLTALVSTLSASAACEFTLDVKKAGAKTAYAKGGVSVSSKIREALESQGCKIKYNVMSEEQIKGMKVEQLKKQLAKLTQK